MLVLTRKVGERVLIDGGIVVQVLEVHGQRIRLGFEAPPDVVIRREELEAIPAREAAPQVPVRKPR
jgi:carbon storage regulator